MPRGRPPKRPNEDPDSPSGDEAKLKLPRLLPEDFSTVVKHKLQSYTRTGQACDRCKVRKIRCDGLPEGCSPCLNQNLECYVTDRVTGRTERRGYLQDLERQKTAMRNHIQELERLLADNGVEVRPWQWPPYPHDQPDGVTKGEWSRVGSLWVRGDPNRAPTQPVGYSRAAVLESRPVDSHLGVFADCAPLALVKGTQLSVLGTTIDIMSFDAPDMENDPPGAHGQTGLYNKSLRAFLRSTTNNNPPLENVQLPSRSDAFQYSEWYFLMVFPFTPILHQATYMNLLTRIYDDPSFKPTTSELVIVHMVFAQIYFQYGVRNREEANRQTHLNELSDKHYHWSLSKFYELAVDPAVTSVQALCMIGSHTRSFPKPGCGSLIAGFIVNKAVELNLHRDFKVPGGGTNLENEIRRRAWWSALSLLVTLNGRLGKPMPMTLEEFDTDFPIAIPDEYLTDQGVTDPSKIGQCSFLVGLVGFKITPLYMEMYSNLYSVRRDPRRYMEVVTSLEAQHRRWEESLPDDLNVERCKPGTQIFALYTQAFSLELRLCLRHPSVCMTRDAKFCAENTRVCEETAKKLLRHVRDLLRLKSLDTTWYQMSVYCAAMFSTLVAHWERRFETTPEEIATLKDDMGSWLAIITEISLLIGTSSGRHLTSEVDKLVSRTIAWIEQDMGRKPRVSPGNSAPPLIPLQHVSGTKQEFPPQHALGQPHPSTPNGDGSHAQSSRSGTGYYGAPVPSHPPPYPPLAYHEQPGVVGGGPPGNGMTYDASGNPSYLYSTTAAAVAAAASQNSPGPGPTQAPGPLVDFAPPGADHLSSQHGSGGGFVAPGNPWHDWTAAMADSQDRYSANALLNLHAAPLRGSVEAPPGGDASAQMQWPLLIFHVDAGAPSGA